MITEVTLEILPEFDVHQRVYGGISVDHFIEHAAQDRCRADNVGALIDFGAGEVALLYVRDRVEVGEPMPPPSRHDFGGELVEGDVQAWMMSAGAPVPLPSAIERRASPPSVPRSRQSRELASLQVREHA